jgi:tripartite-type tricarboxylate transporter receptor subunit TctC
MTPCSAGRHQLWLLGSYGTMHVLMEILSKNASVKMTHAFFTGAGPAVAALLGGQIDAVRRLAWPRAVGGR